MITYREVAELIKNNGRYREIYDLIFEYCTNKEYMSVNDVWTNWDYSFNEPNISNLIYEKYKNDKAENERLRNLNIEVYRLALIKYYEKEIESLKEYIDFQKNKLEDVWKQKPKVKEIKYVLKPNTDIYSLGSCDPKEHQKEVEEMFYRVEIWKENE